MNIEKEIQKAEQQSLPPELWSRIQRKKHIRSSTRLSMAMILVGIGLYFFQPNPLPQSQVAEVSWEELLLDEHEEELYAELDDF